MLKKHKTKIILTSLITILPILIGVIFWNRLPDQMVTHWDANGVPNGWSSKTFAVFGLPLFILACHILCIAATVVDPKAQNHSEKILSLIFWICPVTSIFCGVITYSEALGISIPVNILASLFVGLIFIAIGNYLPKCKHNYTIGIKIPWTLNSEENWNRTHRFAGPVWVIAGIAMILLSFWDMVTTFIFAIAAATLLPVLYSYWYYKKYECK